MLQHGWSLDRNIMLGKGSQLEKPIVVYSCSYGIDETDKSAESARKPRTAWDWKGDWPGLLESLWMEVLMEEMDYFIAAYRNGGQPQWLY